MKRIIIVLIALFATFNLNAQKIENYDEYMIILKQNNPSLKALALTLEAQRKSNKIGINPADPTASTNPTFNGETSYSIGVSFAFPTLYYQMKKKAKMTTVKNEFEYYVKMFQELQVIDKSYITAVFTNKKVALLKEAYMGNENIKQHFITSVNKGTSTALELNTAKAELLRSISTLSEAKLEYNNITRELYALNGGVSIEVTSMTYPKYVIGNINTYVERAMEKSYEVQVTNADSLIAAQNIRVNKHSWIPNISVQYAYNMAYKTPHNGYSDITAGISIPIWQNANKVNAAKLEYSAMMENNRTTRLAIGTRLEQLRNSYIMAVENFILHEEFTTSSSSLELLRKSLEGGNMNIIDYYTEVNRLIEISIQRLEYEYRVMTTLAEMQSLLY